MIVITSLSERAKYLMPGDAFNMTIADRMGCEVLICETVTVAKVINYVASYRFALSDGTCPGFHLSGVFANKTELPDELKNAVMLDDLTDEQHENFVRTVGVQIKKRTQ